MRTSLVPYVRITAERFIPGLKPYVCMNAEIHRERESGRDRESKIFEPFQELNSKSSHFSLLILVQLGEFKHVQASTSFNFGRQFDEVPEMERALKNDLDFEAKPGESW